MRRKKGEKRRRRRRGKGRNEGRRRRISKDISKIEFDIKNLYHISLEEVETKRGRAVDNTLETKY